MIWLFDKNFIKVKGVCLPVCICLKLVTFIIYIRRKSYVALRLEKNVPKLIKEGTFL